ncbi:MAG TPA: Yip1 family protein [Xanthobacteraceae bacterium]|jgi:hypothetical protein
MNAALRAKAMIVDPAAEWKRIEQESTDPFFLLSRYVVWLALVPAVFGFIGACVVGVIGPGNAPVRAPLLDGLLAAVFCYGQTIAIVLLLALIVNVLAPALGGRKDFDSAFKLVVYSYTPVWLAGIFQLLPGLRFLMLAGFYGVYPLVAGLPLLMKPAAERTATCTAVIVACACALTLTAAAAQRALFGAPQL